MKDGINVHEKMAALYLAARDPEITDMPAEQLEQRKRDFIHSLSAMQRGHQFPVSPDLDKPVLAREKTTFGMGKK